VQRPYVDQSVIDSAAVGSRWWRHGPCEGSTPAFALVLVMVSVFRFSLCQRKTKYKKKNSTAGHYVSPA